MRRKNWQYFRRRERLRELIRKFKDEHGYQPNACQVQQLTGWSVRSIRDYLRQLIQEGESLHPLQAIKNADRFEERRGQLLDCIQAYHHEHGFYPTHREISNETGWDRNAVRRYLKRLVQEGTLQYNPGKRRTIRLTGR